MIASAQTCRKTTVEHYTRIRRQTEEICRPLLPEDTVVQPMVDVSPPKWHLAHTTWFFETFVLKPYLKGYSLFHDRYGYLFNSYYNSIGSRVLRAARGTLTRPALAEVYDYRRHVDTHMCLLLQQEDALAPELWQALELGLQHEQQHQELLLTDIKYILSTNPLAPAFLPATAYLITDLPATAGKLNFLDVPGGIYTIGYSGTGFCFDNEQAPHQVLLQDFKIADRLVTNKEYITFMQDGGYSDFRHWLDEGFALVKSQHLEAPLYWVQQDGNWFRYTLHGLQPLHPDAPVCHLSFYEADAYANWCGERLLTEFEWEAASQFFQPSVTNSNFTETGLLDPAPAAKENGSCRQLFGDAWEWTYSSYHPYPGYSKAPGALGEYNGKFMLNQMVLRGGSCATPGSHIRNTYRNFFHPDKCWQFTGIRLAKK